MIKIRITQQSLLITVLIVIVLCFAVPGIIHYFSDSYNPNHIDGWIIYSRLVLILLGLITLGFSLFIIGSILEGGIKLFNPKEIVLWRSKEEKLYIKKQKQLLIDYEHAVKCLKIAKKAEEYDEIKYMENKCNELYKECRLHDVPAEKLNKINA